jgi:Na+-driven multidrug efflux pump
MQTAMQIVSIPLQGFTQGANPVISYNYGKGDANRVKEGAMVMFGVMFTWNLVLTLFFILRPGIAASLFTQDAALTSCVEQVMPVFLLGMTIFGAQRASQNMFVSLNQPKVSLFIALLRKVILLVPLALILPKFFGAMGIFAAEAIADGTAAICCILIFASRFPKILAAMQKPET